MQRAGCMAFATAKGFGGPAVEYVGDGVAGDDIEGMRALHRLLADAQPGDVVICRDQSRLARKARKVTDIVAEIVEERRARLFYYASGEEVAFASAIDEAMTFIRGTAHQIELEAIRSRVREALRARVKAGRIAGGRCYGYDLRRVSDGAKEHTIAVVNDREAAVIVRIFREYVGGAGFKAIALRLNAERVPGPVARRRGSGSWSPNQIRDIVRRERYRGVYIHGRVDRPKKNGKRLTKKAAPDQVIRLDVPEWRIVDDELWTAAQATFRARTPGAKSESRAAYALSGVASCATCRGSIGVVHTKVVNGVRMRSYGCIRHATRGATVCPMGARRPVGVVEDALAEALRTACERPDVVDAVLLALRTTLEREAAALGSVDVSALEAELAETRREHRNLLRLAATLDEDDLDVVREIKARRERIAQLERSLAVATRAPVEAAAMFAHAEQAVRDELADIAARLAEPGPKGRDFFRSLFPDGIVVEPHPTERARWLVTGGLDLSKRLATPGGSASICSPNLPCAICA